MAHRQRAELVRSGQASLQQSFNESGQAVPPGTVAILVRDVNRQPVAQQQLKLSVTHQSIAEGNETKAFTQVTDPAGRAGFIGQSTDTSFNYEVTTEYAGGNYSSGAFQLKRDAGQIVVLTLFPSTPELERAFVFSRVLYVVQPRDDVFELQFMIRLHNAGAVTWLAQNVPLQLPAEAKAFRPGESSGDLKLRLEDGRVLLNGTLPPGQHEVAFNFHLPNPRLASAHFRLPVPPNVVDARIYTEGSSTTAMTVDGFGAATETRGKDGQRALLASQDFLRADDAPPAVFSIAITGLPTRGYAAWLAAIVAGCIALLGVSFAFTKDASAERLDSDRKRARGILLEELVLLEKARRRDEIGPKTYDQTRRVLLDALARLDDGDRTPTPA
jgi:hypothetical protein